MGKHKGKDKGKKGKGRARSRIATDLDQARRDRAKADSRSGGADFHTLDPGQTLGYFPPAIYASHPLPYVEYQIHFQFGGGRKVAVNLDGMEDCEPMLDALEKKGIGWDKAEKGWLRAEELVAESGDERQALGARWMFPFVPLKHRKSTKHEWKDLEPEVVLLGCGSSIYDGITDIMFEDGDDITNPDGAILVRILKTGKGMDTRYKVTADKDTLIEPYVLEDAEWKVVERELKPGGKCDVFKTLANMVRTAKQMEKVFEGGDDDDDDDSKPRRSKTKTRPAKPSRENKRRPRTSRRDPDAKKAKGKPAKGKKKKRTVGALDATLKSRGKKKR